MRRLNTKQKIALSVLSLVLVIALVAVFYIQYMMSEIDHEPFPRADVDLSIPKEAVKRSQEAETINVLLIGSDRRSKRERGRSDTLIVLTLDQKGGAVKLTSIMRDTYVHIPGRGKNRINAAYSYGGPALAVKTLNSNFRLDLREYVEIDFAGLEKVVDRLGGLHVDVRPVEARAMRGHMRPGRQRLSGERTLEYVRLRKIDSDFDRTRRQRKVLGLLIDKVEERGLSRMPSTVKALSPFVKTSLSKTEILRLAAIGARLGGDTEELRIPVDDGYSAKRIRGMDVLVPDMEYNRLRIQDFVYGE